jgi:hypothetical protein
MELLTVEQPLPLVRRHEVMYGQSETIPNIDQWLASRCLWRMSNTLQGFVFEWGDEDIGEALGGMAMVLLASAARRFPWPHSLWKYIEVFSAASRSRRTAFPRWSGGRAVHGHGLIS